MRVHGVTPRGKAQVLRSPLNQGLFGRMFRKLPPAPERSEAELQEIAESMRESSGQTGAWGQANPEPPEGDNDSIPAAYTYFGQFLDHDITFDPTSRPHVQNDPDALLNFRTPRYDLDSLYGSGPVDEPFQYDQQLPGRLLVGANTAGEPDLPRNAQGIALIGDPRNDENAIVSALQLVMLRFHNRMADRVEQDATVPDYERFDETRRRVRWHYQWVVVNDYLKRICDGELIDKLLKYGAGTGRPDFNLRYYKPREQPYMPVEFSAAAFRFGHSQLRSAYVVNGNFGARPLFVPGDDPTTADLRGRRPMPSGGSVDWSGFLRIGASDPQPSRKIDTTLAPTLFDLPNIPGSEIQSLAVRNLIRGQSLLLPSGQDVAVHLKLKPLGAADLAPAGEDAPLWFYVLRESQLMPEAPEFAGQRLGPTGAHIVAEVILGLLEADPTAYVNEQPGWRPEIPGNSGVDGTFGLPDLVSFALS